jgi:RNA polymerase sigma-70 factor (ECF subfamily)
MLARSHQKKVVETDDLALIARIATGDLEALGELFDLHARSVRALARRLGVSASDVDDLVQLVFLDVLKVASRHDGRPVRPWILGMTAVAVRRHRRSLTRWVANIAGRVFEARRPLPGTADDALERQQELARFQNALHKLSPKKREVFVMVVIEELRGEDVATALGIPVATVWTRLHHARKELRAALEEEAP